MADAAGQAGAGASEAVIELPSLLAHLTGGRREIDVQGATVRDALGDLVRRCPALGVHLFDETGGLREHVLCFHNGSNTRWGSLDTPLAGGDRLRIYQAVSGG